MKLKSEVEVTKLENTNDKNASDEEEVKCLTNAVLLEARYFSCHLANLCEF